MTIHEDAIAREGLLEQRRQLESQIANLESQAQTNVLLLKNLRRQLDFVDLQIKSPVKAAEVEAAEQAAFESRFDEFHSA